MVVERLAGASFLGFLVPLLAALRRSLPPPTGVRGPMREGGGAALSWSPQSLGDHVPQQHFFRDKGGGGKLLHPSVSLCPPIFALLSTPPAVFMTTWSRPSNVPMRLQGFVNDVLDMLNLQASDAGPGTPPSSCRSRLQPCSFSSQHLTPALAAVA